MNIYEYTSDNYDATTLKEHLDANMATPCYPSTAGSTITIQTEADKATLDLVMNAYLAQDNLLIAAQAENKEKIDIACGAKREALVSRGFCVLEEYRLAYDQAKPWADGGYIEPAPSTVASWATASGWTNTQAADDIIATREAWMGVLEGIRNVRLSGKANVDAATTVEEAEAAYQAVLVALG